MYKKNDIYFDKKYGELYENIDKGKCIEYNFDHNLGKIKYIFLKRPIKIQGLDEQFYDIITPYGYGGPIITGCNLDSKESLIREFNKEFNDFCNRNNIVSEFVRFHPIYDNGEDFKIIYEIETIRKTVATEINNDINNYENQFSKSARKTIRRCLRDGLTYEYNIHPKNLDTFQEVYYSTMDRKSSDEYYYFDQLYFNDFIKNFGENILNINIFYKNNIIASSLYFYSNQILNAHLSGTKSEFLYLSPAYLLKYASYEWGKANNIKLIHYGGGTSNALEDSLLKFKRKFGKKEFDFKVAKKVRNTSIYNKLINITGNQNSTFFPAYRNITRK
ncbi:hypothetical protein [Facklamia sp. P9177]|uniref:hypothetical protein n=1 Tax=Facklamia sp. P9177 TaxID=3421945 RepID=UPI003D183790